MTLGACEIFEVGPRDGLQNEAREIPLAEKVALVDCLSRAGFSRIEVASFVSPARVPQMAGSAGVLSGITRAKGVRYAVLTPNMRGYENAVAAGVKTVAVVASATETMNQKNINMSLAETFEVARSIIERGHSEGITVQAYLSVAFECPFEGAVEPALICKQAQQLAQWGADEIVIADTIGAANPAQVQKLMTSLIAEHGSDLLACHFHDTRAMGLANVYAAIESGVRRFDSALGGLGGCPFAPGAKGNVATEDVVMMCEQMGFSTGVDMPALLRAVELVSGMTGVQQGGRAHYWISNNAA